MGRVIRFPSGIAAARVDIEQRKRMVRSYLRHPSNTPKPQDESSFEDALSDIARARYEAERLRLEIQELLSGDGS